MRNSRTGARIFAGAIGTAFAVQFILALGYPPDPRLFPLIIAGAGVLLAVALEFGVGLPAATIEPSSAQRMVLAVVLPPLFAFGLWLLGFWIATLVSIPVVAWLLGYRKLPVLLCTTLGMAAAIGLLFPLVNVSPPRGAVFGPHFWH